MKFEIKQFVIFAILAYIAYTLSSYITPMVPATGNQTVTQAIIFIVPLFILWFVWINWGKKTADDVAQKV
jgi:hypothetical protein